MFRSTRRGAVLGVAAATLTFTALPAFAAENIIIGVPAAQSGPVGVADHQDWTNGVQMAIEDINAAGGVLGRQLEAKIIDLDMLSPEGNVAGFQALIEGVLLGECGKLRRNPVIDHDGRCIGFL